MRYRMQSMVAATALFATSIAWAGAVYPQAGTNFGGPPPVHATINVEQGRHFYVVYGCYQCHGYAGQGSQSTGPALVALSRNDTSIMRYVRVPQGVMPAFSAKLLPAQSLALIVDYLHTLKPGRSAAQIPLLARYVAGVTPPSKPAIQATAASSPTASAILVEGKQLYQANCAVCHGADRQGVVGPSLVFEANKRSLAETAQFIISPPPGMPKLSPPLTVSDVHKIAEYVRSGN